MKGAEAACGVCGTLFQKKMKSQRYCTRPCYTKAWHINNPEKNAARSAARKKAKPEWYREHEPLYYRNHRKRQVARFPWRYLFKSARARAKEKGWAYELDDAWASARWTGTCEITGVPFQVNMKSGPHPFSPSIDRKDSALGYTKENTRFILWGCNAIKGVGTDEDVLSIAKAIVRASEP